jgi:hypothetical protein
MILLEKLKWHELKATSGADIATTKAEGQLLIDSVKVRPINHDHHLFGVSTAAAFLISLY